MFLSYNLSWFAFIAHPALEKMNSELPGFMGQGLHAPNVSNTLNNWILNSNFFFDPWFQYSWDPSWLFSLSWHQTPNKLTKNRNTRRKVNSRTPESPLLSPGLNPGKSYLMTPNWPFYLCPVPHLHGTFPWGRACPAWDALCLFVFLLSFCWNKEITCVSAVLLSVRLPRSTYKAFSLLNWLLPLIYFTALTTLSTACRR